MAVADRRTQILEAACSVIARDGAHGLRMADVAREAGVSNALVHYYVPTRAELVRDAFEFANARADAALAERSDPALPSPERLHALLVNEFEDSVVVRESWVLWQELWSAALHDDALRPQYLHASRRWHDAIAAILVEDGRAPDPEASAQRLASLVDGLGSKVLVGELDAEQARALVRGAIALELGQ